jgi:heat shock protein HtpX
VKFVWRSLFILLALYGIVFAIGDAYLTHVGAPPWLAVSFAVGLVAVQYLVSPWLIGLFLDIVWDDSRSDLPAVNREFLERLCAERGLKVPRIGIIYSGTPNAFSFGRLRADARIVVTKGLLDVLSPEEANAVLAHELGHIEHYDFVIITIAALAPLLLYQIYAFTRGGSHSRAIAYGAYLCYWIAQYIVLLLNRAREYFADQYAAEVTHHPDALSSALVKIAYGLVRAEGDYRESLTRGSRKDKAQLRRQQRLAGAVALLGIANVRSGAALALGMATPDEAAAVMRWDLVNPWARVYEMSSTHPLTALRVRALNHASEAMQQTVQYPLPQDQRIRWGAFPLEVILWAAPWVCAAVLIADQFFGRFALPPGSEPALLIALGLTWLIRIAYRYRGEFADQQIGRLLEDLEVSQMRPRAVRLRGEIIGRGVPGAFWSPDLVLRDATGMIFLLYRQSIPFARLLFGMRKADEYIGSQVEVEGWFRRGLAPYLEMSRLTAQTSKGPLTRRTYSRWIQYLLAAAVVAAGYLWMVR